MDGLSINTKIPTAYSVLANEPVVENVVVLSDLELHFFLTWLSTCPLFLGHRPGFECSVVRYAIQQLATISREQWWPSLRQEQEK